MSYTELYKKVQDSGKDRISTKWLRGEAIGLSEIVKIKEQWSGVIDAGAIRSFYIEGPFGPPVPLKEREALIVLSRGVCTGPQGDYWRRFIYTKELMHVFDTVEEKADTKEKFDKQIKRLKDVSAEVTPQFRAERKAIWRALGVLCREQKRLEYKKLLENKKISPDVVAASLSLPIAAVEELMDASYEKNIKDSM